jgi:hypothetical protein
MTSYSYCAFRGAATAIDGESTGHLDDLVHGRCPLRSDCSYCDEGIMHAGHVCGNWNGEGKKPPMVQAFEDYHHL